MIYIVTFFVTPLQTRASARWLGPWAIHALGQKHFLTHSAEVVMDTFKILKISGFVSSEKVDEVMRMIRAREYQETGTRISNMITAHEVGDFVRGVTVSGRPTTLYLASRYLVIDFGPLGSDVYAGEVMDWIHEVGISFKHLSIKTSEGGFDSFESLKEARNAFYS